MYPAEALRLAVDSIKDTLTREKIKCFELNYWFDNGSVVIQFRFPTGINADGTAVDYCCELDFNYELKVLNDDQAYIKEIARVAKKFEGEMRDDIFSEPYSAEETKIIDRIFSILKGEKV